MNTSDFIIKRGMVFYLEEPGKSQPIPVDAMQKRRPYIVISCDQSNMSGGMYVHVLPMTTKPPKENHKMPWMVPLKKRDGTVTWAKCNEVIYVEKNLCNIATYSEALSSMIIGNGDTMKRITAQVARHFGITADDVPCVSTSVENPVETVKENVAEPMVEQKAEPTPIQPTNTSWADADSFTVSFSVAGLGPVSFTVGKNTVQTTADPVIEQKAEHKNEKPKTIAVKDCEKYKKDGKLTKEGQKMIMSVISTQYRKFGGTLTQAQIADMFGVSMPRVGVYVRRVQDALNKGEDPTADHKRYPSIKLTEVVKRHFMADYSVLNLGQMYAKYKKYGFTGTDHIFNYYKALAYREAQKKKVTVK
jgi:mRNA-degrading endonuclease toxin of MazEF toxin-antitoxin module